MSLVRRTAAHVAWIAAQAAWEREDAAVTVRWLDRAVRWQPERVDRWITAARILAFDLPRWPNASGFDDEVAWVIRAEQWLEAARRVHGDLPALWIEQGRIRWLVRGDFEGAHAAFQAAARLHGLRSPAEAWIRALEQSRAAR